MNKDLEITKGIMTYMHLILGNEPEKNYTFSSIRELYNRIDVRLESADTTDKASYNRKELLNTFDQSIEWMKARKIIISDHGKNGHNQSIKIDKAKLVKYIIDPELPLLETNEDSDS